VIFLLLGAPLSNGSLNNNAGGELDYMEKIRGDEPEEEKAASKRSAGKTGMAGSNATPRDTSRKGRSSAVPTNAKDESNFKMESDLKKYKVDLQLSRNKENDLRDQIVSYMTSKSWSFLKSAIFRKTNAIVRALVVPRFFPPFCWYFNFFPLGGTTEYK
jgi:hypothetical protein